MTDPRPARRYRFGVFEADAATGELRRQGIRIKLNAQPFQVLLMLLERPGELLTREEISRELWPDGTFVDYEHGVNSAVNRIREASETRRAVRDSSRPWPAAAIASWLPSNGSPAMKIRRRRRPNPPPAPACETAISIVRQDQRQLRPTPRPIADSGLPAGAAEDLVSGRADALRSPATHVPGLLRRRAGQSGGD